MKNGFAQDVALGHRLKIAKATLRYSDIGARIMGGMTKADARLFLESCGWTKTRIINFEEAAGNYEGGEE